MKKVLNSLIFVCLSQWAFGSGAVISYGGEEIIRKTHSVADSIAKRISNVPQFLLPQKNLFGRIQTEMRTLNIIVSATPVVWEGSEVFAVNYPYETPKRLVISEKKWQYVESHSLDELDRLVLHEILPLIGIMDRNYENSTNIMQVLTSFKSWDSTRYFMSRYLDDNTFLATWAEKSGDYYENWGTDNGQLITQFAYRVFPVRNSDVNLWLTIFDYYLNQYSTNICFQATFPVEVKNIRYRNHTVYTQVYNRLRDWYKKQCADVPGALSLD